VAMQLGAGVPTEFSGDQAHSDPVPPYPVPPAGPDWWSGQQSSTATNGKIWMPDLPRLPGTARTSTPFDMPAAFNCKVYFPGRYTTPLSLTGNVYFASGVYYFEKPVTVSGNADVVVGYGLEELPNPDCSDDIQVAANVIGDPGTFDINGGGATWVFGRDGRLVVDDSTTTTSLGIRFNQRYADADRGGRVSIMTVNGDDATAGAGHVVTNVNSVPRSFLLNDATQVPIDGSGYAPSASTYTDKARLPQAPTSFTSAPLKYDDAGTTRGAILLTWNEVAGQAAGGAFIDGYDVAMSPTPSGAARCQPADLVVTELPSPPGARQVACLAKGLTLGTTYTIGVRARNEVGQSPSVGGTAMPSSTSPLISVPGAPINVAVADSNVDDVAQVSWEVPANGGAPITSYVATAHRVYLEPQPDAPPLAGAINLVTTAAATVISGVPAFDPNGDALTLTVDDSGLDPAVAAVTVNGLEVSITTTATAPGGTYVLPYSVTDPAGGAASGTITVVVSATTSNAAPVAAPAGLAANVAVPIVSRVPVFDPNGDALTLTADSSALDVADWTVTVTGLEVTITTTAGDGTYSIPYTVQDPSGQVAS
ncbi:MAG: Ig-like domain-containing protein, partial [Ilumatobacteraceae bacterium]